MLERSIQALQTDDAGAETPGDVRNRLKGNFPAGATRRMTTLGLLVGNALAALDPREDEAIVYASGYAEAAPSRASWRASRRRVRRSFRPRSIRARCSS